LLLSATFKSSVIIPTQEQARGYFFKVARRTLALVALEFFTCSCARIMVPEGGPKDTIPPKLIRTFPARESTGFRGKTIRLVFDKEIEVHDIYNKLVVTPRLQKLKNRPSYTYTVRGKTLKLTLEAPLQEETTYTFNFNDAIKDTTEGNIAEGLVLTLCTGDRIDTMYVTGQVKHLMTHESAAKVLVALCKVDNDNLNIFGNPPDYFIKTDEKGKFKLDHVKEGKYYLYASTSKNNELTVDPGADAYGFLKDPIDLTTVPLEEVTLSILKADVREFKLQSQQPQGQYFELSFNKPVVDYTLTLAHRFEKFEKSPTLYSHLVEDKQVIRVYNTFGLLEEDSLEAYLTAKDVLGAVLEEKITVQFGEKRSRTHPASYAFKPATGAAIHPDFVGIMTINKPVKEVVAGRLSFVFNNKKKIRINTEDLQLNTQRDVITITKQLAPDMLQLRKNVDKEGEAERLIFQMEEGAFVTVEGDSSKAMRYTYTLRDPKEYGTIQGTITTEAPGFIVQLLDSAHNVIDSLRNERNYQFNGIAPGDYKLRLLILQEKDGEWCFGNIYERKEPDPVVLYPDDVAVIANWRVEGIDFYF
jgi:Bacterial Ig-like domain